jgi:hypothetical protein
MRREISPKFLHFCSDCLPLKPPRPYYNCKYIRNISILADLQLAVFHDRKEEKHAQKNRSDH